MHIYNYMCICICIYIISWCVQHFDTKHRILCARALARPIQRRFRGGHRDGMQWPWRPAVMETWLYLSPSPSPGVWSPGVWDRWIHLSSYIHIYIVCVCVLYIYIYSMRKKMLFETLPSIDTLTLFWMFAKVEIQYIDFAYIALNSIPLEIGTLKGLCIYTYEYKYKYIYVCVCET